MPEKIALSLLAFVVFLGKVLVSRQATQQSVHLTLGILRQSQAVFYALAFFWLDGLAHPNAGNANR